MAAPPPDDPVGMQRRLETYARYSMRARFLVRVQLLAVAVTLGGVGILVLIPAGGAWVYVLVGVVLPVMLVSGYLAVVPPIPWFGSPDPVTDLSLTGESIRVRTWSGRTVDVPWSAPDCALRFRDYSATRSPIRDVVVVEVAHHPELQGGLNRDDVDRLEAAAEAHGLRRRVAERVEGLSRAKVVETTFAPA